VRVPDADDQTDDGTGLQLEGPKVAIEIAVPTVLAEFLARNGMAVPPARSGFALIDTGASITAVDEQVVASLGIQPIGRMKLSTPSQSRSAWLYAARLTCSGVAIPPLEVLDIVGCTLQPQGFIALLGRNFLRKVVLVYDGPGGFFTLL
jgi:predicted aspartyl protease